MVIALEISNFKVEKIKYCKQSKFKAELNKYYFCCDLASLVTALTKQFVVLIYFRLWTQG